MKIVRELPAEVLWLPLFLLMLILLPVTLASGISCGAIVALQMYRLRGQRGRGVWVQLLGLPATVFVLMAFVSRITWVEERGLLLLQVLAIILLSASLLVSQLVNSRQESEATDSCDSARQKALKLEGWQICKTNLMLAFPSLVVSTLCACCDIPASYRLGLAWLNVCLFSLWAAYKCVYLSWMLPRLEQEQWVPVVDSQEQVVGLTPLSALDGGAGRLPIVRLMLVAEGMLFLEHIRLNEAGKIQRVYDTPFSSWLMDAHSPEEVAYSMLEDRCCGLKDLPLRRLLQYNGTTRGQSCLIYLFVAVLDDPNKMQIHCQPSEGKWWCVRQLKEQIELCPDDFSDTIRLEYPYLKETILLAQSL